MLCLSLQIDGWRVLYNTLYGHLNKFVKTVQLLSHKTLFVEVGVDDNPTGFLPQLMGDFFRILLLVQFFKIIEIEKVTKSNTLVVFVEAASQISAFLFVAMFFSQTFFFYFSHLILLTFIILIHIILWDF